jgi:integral membrane protein
MPARPMSAAGRLFSWAAIFEAITWTGLLLGMLLKYGTGTTELGVWLFGRLHGVAFLLYVVVCLYAGVRQRWPLWALLVALLAAVPPLLTVPVEIWFRRIGLLSPPPTEARQPAA